MEKTDENIFWTSESTFKLVLAYTHPSTLKLEGAQFQFTPSSFGLSINVKVGTFKKKQISVTCHQLYGSAYGSNQANVCDNTIMWDYYDL